MKVWEIDTVAGAANVIPIPSTVDSFLMMVNSQFGCCVFINSRVNFEGFLHCEKIACSNPSATVGYSSDSTYGAWWDGTNWYCAFNITSVSKHFRLTVLY